MGDYYQTIADLDADAQTAPELASRLREWMISRQIIVPEKTDCVLGKSLGYAPGNKYELAADTIDNFRSGLATNGVAFIEVRTVFCAISYGPTAICSTCHGRFEVTKAWSSAVDEWYDGKGPGMVACVHCGAETPLAEWQLDPPWAFGCLGVKFWNWPNLRPEFIEEVGKFLGHRVRLVWGKL